MKETRRIFNLDFLAADNFDALVEDVLHRPTDAEHLPFIITPNVDLTVHLNKNKELLPYFQRSRYILPDGFPIILFSKILGRPLKKRLAGSDLFPVVWKTIKREQQKAFFIAPSNAVKEILEKEYADCRFYIPPFFEANDAEVETEAQRILPQLLDFSPKHVFLGLRYPKQEMLILNLYQKLNERGAEIPVFYNLGASYEFYTGLKERAPRWMQKSGLEWLHRFLSEPKRTFRRYFWDDLYIFVLFLKEILRREK